MRAVTVNGFKMCFPNAHRNDNLRKLGCVVEDSISHVFSGLPRLLQHRLKRQERTPCLDLMSAIGLLWADEHAGCSYVSEIRPLLGTK